MGRKAKLTSAKVLEIRLKRTNGIKIKDLALEYGVSTFVIGQALKGVGAYQLDDRHEQLEAFPDGEV